MSIFHRGHTLEISSKDVTKNSVRPLKKAIFHESQQRILAQRSKFWFHPKGVTGRVVRYRSSLRLALIGCVFLVIPQGRLPIRAEQPFTGNQTPIISLKKIAEPIISDLAQRTRFRILNECSGFSMHGQNHREQPTVEHSVCLSSDKTRF